MRNAAAMLYCPNPTCQAPNSEDHKFCQKCSTLLPRRYLWALGEGASDHQPRALLAERYLCKQSRVFLDTKPGLLSGTYQELPDAFLPYLRLVSYPLHIPQVYDWLPDSAEGPELILLDHAAIGRFGRTYSSTSTLERGPAGLGSAGLAPEPDLLPAIMTEWQQAAASRQLNWLWQIANLWQPLSAERATASLLDAENLRIDSTLVRLLELQFDEPHSLVDLGYFWLAWAESAQPEVAGFLTKLCQSLIEGQLHNAELLVGHLDEALAQMSQGQIRQMQIATLSDRGPTRPRNEDACYPVSGTHSSNLNQSGNPTQANLNRAPKTLLIVCDGIGGHQGGDVASNLAISTLEQQVKSLAIDQLDPVSLTIDLEKAICAANDKISQQNDSEQRFERQRMGTTVVMALARAHELYITHVGDSRVYWLTRWGCYQITLDDDVASREVRLGYSFYRQALHQPSAGSLVQALGMSASSMLYPTVQRLIPDEAGIFLLCSDGLSDNDRVEEAWETEILPLLESQAEEPGSEINLTALSQRLVEIANTRNGYDNVTVGLLHYQVLQPQTVPVLAPVLADLPEITAPLPAQISETQPTELIAPVVTPPVTSANYTPNYPSNYAAVSPVAPRSRQLLPLMLLGIGVVGLLGLLLGFWPTLRSLNPQSATPPTPSNQPQPASPTSNSLEVGTLVQLNSAQEPNQKPILVSRPESEQPVSSPSASPSPSLPPSPSPSPSVSLPSSPLVGNSSGSPSVSPKDVTPAVVQPAGSKAIGMIPTGAILEVLRKQSLSQQESWIELRVCSIGPSQANSGQAIPRQANSGQASSSQTSTPSTDTAPVAPTVASTTAPTAKPTAVPLLQPGQTGWIQELDILPQVTLRTDLSPEQQACS